MKRKVGFWLLVVTKCLVVAALWALAFYLNVWAGVTAIGFSIAGFLLGWFNRQHRMQEKFFAAIDDHIGDALEGKLVTIVSDDETGNLSVQVSELPKETKKVKKEKKGKKEEVLED